MKPRPLSIAAGLLLAFAAPLAAQSASPSRDPSPHQVRWTAVDSSIRLEVLDWGGSGPVLAIYQAQLPFDAVASEYEIRNEQERAALRQEYNATRALYARWQQELLAAIPMPRIVDLPGANLYMFLSNEADVLRDIRAFATGH